MPLVQKDQLGLRAVPRVRQVRKVLQVAQRAQRVLKGQLVQQEPLDLQGLWERQVRQGRVVQRGLEDLQVQPV